MSGKNAGDYLSHGARVLIASSAREEPKSACGWFDRKRQYDHPVHG